MSHAGRTIIRGGTVIDGTGAAPRRADVVIEGETIADVAGAGAAEAATTIDATGCVVCPGFIDPHNHADTEVRGGVAAHPLADNLIRQGITTLICNQCGGGTYPIAPLLDKVDELRPATNIAMLASHGCARNAAMKETGVKTPGPAMWTAMKRILTAEMESGALGVTAGPLMCTQEQLPTEELVEAGRAVAPFGGVYASHIRDEGETGRHLEAIEEVYTVARESGCRGHVSHIKLWGKPNWGQTAPVLDIFDRAARQGVVLRADQYPYIGGYRGFFSIMWTCQAAKVLDDAWRRLAKAEIVRQLDLLGGPERFILSSHENNDPLDGLNLAEIGQTLGVAPEEAPIHLFLREPRPRLSAFFLMMQEDDVKTFMRCPHVMVGTDSHLRIPGSGASHPRNFGSYPRLLAKYVREEKVMPLERMIYRMTRQVAEQFNIKKRGRLAAGMSADVVVFDPLTVQDRSTWKEGSLYPEGIRWVLVNGGIAVADGRFLRKGFGRALRRGSA